MMMSWFAAGILLVSLLNSFVSTHEGGLPAHYPSYLKTGKYAQSFNQPPGHGGMYGNPGLKLGHTGTKTKTPVKKTFTKSSSSYTKTGGSSSGSSYSSYSSSYGGGGASSSYYNPSSIMFNGGCAQQPRPPMNSMIRCNINGCNATCMDGYRFADGKSKISMKCLNGVWSVEKPAWQNFGVAEAIPASCEAICSPPCENNGICYAPNKCNCPDNFSGPRCESSRRPCLNYPALPLNARRTCSTTACTITCLKGHQFPDGSGIATMKCMNGEWIPIKNNWNTVPDCEATCSPPCENGGNCLSLNMCQCPQDFRGPQCQYRADSCSAKRLQFNGAYNCSGDSDSLSCTLSCPPTINFDITPAKIYTCTYATGVFKPQPIPQCVYAANMEIIPIGGGKESYYETITNSNYSFESGKYRDLNTWKKQYTSGAGRKGGSYSTFIQPNLINDTNYGSATYIKHKSREDQLLTVQQRLPSPGTCFTWGGAHYKTFDNTIFSGVSDCAHTLVRDATDNIFSVVIQNSPGCTQSGSNDCFKIVKLFIQDKEFTLTRDKTNSEVPVLLGPKNKRLPIPGQVPGLRVKLQGHHVVISLDVIGVSVRWDGQKLVQVDVTQSMWNRTEGLCGRFDGDKDNDMIAKDGLQKKTVISFLDSWKVHNLGDECDSSPSDTNICSLSSSSKTTVERARGFCAQLLADKKFTVCQEVMDVNLLMDACQWDYCACAKDGTAEPTECACQTMNMYVRECRQKGVKEAELIRWRDDETCPMKCTGGRIYKSCGPAGGLQQTCGDTEIIETDTDDLSECEEGCYCPEGTVLHEGRCIDRADCPCKLRGKSFGPGEQVPKECNTCTCENGQWKCTEIKCGARCSAIGDPHYQTFDGKRYDFMGKCSYYLVKTDNYSVEAENVACPGSISQAMNFPVNIAAGMPSCTKAVTVRTSSGHIVKLKQNREVTVDGVEVTDLPYYIDYDVIRVPSSMFIVLELENGMEIWWDGVTRVYVNVPASLRDTTRGLCGTFNSNQKDDFLTPEGDIEQGIIPFANKWKVDEKCDDVKDDPHSKDHPCKVNVHNKAKAEEYCAHILSDMFNKCHWLVDSQSFYEDCLFDMCSCENKLSQCLCPIISAYAKECAALGTIVDWRKEVPECGVQCPGGGQVYQVCGDSCTRSCADISSKPNCNKQCVEGCNCPEGQTLDEYGECIPVGQCPCVAEGLQFPAGYKEIRPATLAQELCTCTNALWPCHPASKEDIAKYPKSSDRQTVCSATKNQEFTTCEPAVPTTCRNMHDKNVFSVSSAVCHPGCKCKSGYVLRDAHGGDGVCVKPEECPCHHGGRSFIEGESVQNDCNNCTCTQGKWTCTDKKCPSTCSAWGDSHYRTFDGKTYDYQGQCDYILAKGSLGKHDGFEVTVQSVPCGSLGVSCSRSLTISVAGEKITLTKDKPIPPHATLKRMSLRQTDLFVIVEAEDLGITVQWDKGTRVYVRADPRWKGRVKGLCGNYNDDQLDDFQTPSGGFSEVSAQIFGDSWRLQPYCPHATEIVDTCALRPERRSWAVKKCGILKSDLFAKCHSEVPVEEYLNKCTFDACACDQGGDCECLCTALAAYAQECNMRGIAVHWRSKELCPLQCDENCSKYSPCISTCPQETCDNLLVNSKLGRLCSQETCVEGCAPKPCPPGQVYLNSSAVECVPRATCKPICMELDGVVYSEGDLMEEDECHRCYCTRTNKVCTGKPCDVTTTTTTPAPNDNTVKCKSGWTEWLNQDKPKNRQENKNGRKLDIEPLPSPLLLNSLPADGGRCNFEKMTDIQCRTVDGHIDPKATGLDVECSLERGLVCKADRAKGIKCPDFEIRVLCSCTKKKTIKKHKGKHLEECDVNAPNKRHETDCHAFYQCVPDVYNNIFVEKTCGPSMWYNPKTMICDWPDSVVQIRPECVELEKNITDKPRTIVQPVNIDDDGRLDNATLCPPGFKYTECGTECYRLCMYYTFAVRQRGLCLTGSACEAGCIHESRQLSCPPGMLWRDNSTCVSIADCVCRSHDGSPVKPGTVIKESDCEYCQCIDNHYTCDRSACTTTREPTTEIPTLAPGVEPVTYSLPFDIFETEIPPEQCDEDRYIKLLEPGADWPVSDAAFTASSVLNEAHQPWHGRHGAKVPATSAGAWSPRDSNLDQYLQVDLGRVEPIYGVIILGNPLYDEYVTSFQVLYSQDPTGKNWKYSKTKTGMPQLFRGSIDQRTPVRALFDVPVEARYIRVNPRSWHNEISLRIDLIGCGELHTTTTPAHITTSILDSNWEWLTTAPPQEMCDEPMGVDNNELADHQITVSSDKKPNLPAHGLRLNGTTGWRPWANTPNEWVKFDFLEPRNLTGVKTIGGPEGWVSAYKVLYSHDDLNWNPITDNLGSEKTFLGNFDQDTPFKNTFDKPLKARYLKIVPNKWTSNIQMRVEPLGCFETYPTVEVPVTTESTIKPSICQYCPGIEPLSPDIDMQGDEKCKCTGNHWWDGTDCVSRVQCPCQVGLISYPVGTVFEKEDCSQCLCALGGVAQCEPKQCEPCEQGLRATVSATCGCVCKPCPLGEVLCPTSNICINSTSWCNGVVECPDDEINCESATTIEPLIVSTKAPLAECPPVSCPPGFKIQLKKPNRQEDLQKNLSPMFHMYGGRKTKMDRNAMASRYFGAKGRQLGSRNQPYGYQGSKVLPRKPMKDSAALKKQQQQQHQQICVEFICEPPAGEQIEQCPEPNCPPGYTVVYRNDENIETLEISEPVLSCRSYECHPPPVKDDICNVTGRTFNTFDGTEFKYDICNHVLARDLYLEDWDVSLVKNCTGVCTRDLIIRHGNQIVKMFSDLSLEYNGYRYSAEQTSKIGAKNLAFVVSRLGDTLLFVSNHYGFWIMWNKQGNVKLGVTEKLIGQVDGLCGFYDKDPTNDKRKPNGKKSRTTINFGDSWALGDQSGCEIRTCPLHVQNRAYKMCQSVKERVLAPCTHAIGDIDGWISRCLETACACVEQTKSNEKGGDETDDETDQRCRCTLLEGFVVECTTAKPSVELEDWRMEMECPASCPAPLVHHDCYRRRCEPSCSNLAEADACPTLPNLCFPGCYCPAGLVRKKDKCVTPKECRDCECNVLPHLEYVTFDGANHTANTNCTYIMARDRVVTEGKKHDFEVYVTNEPCPQNPGKMCTSILTLLVNQHRISIQRGATKADDHQVSIDDIPLETLPFDNGWVEITQLPARHINVLVPKLQLQFRAYHPTLGASLKVPSHYYGGVMEGICGDCDRNPDNDNKAPDGLPLRDEAFFVDSWRKPEEDKNCVEEEVKECAEVRGPDGKDPCLVLMDADRFGQCHLLLDPAIFLSTCWHDTCGGRPELACSSLETYALGCRSQGLCIDWHTELCPAKECPLGTEYQLCGPPCAATCDKPKGCPKGKGIPSEGCFCPEGLVLKNGTECVEERECHVCDEEGHYPGDSWQPDACTSCTCENTTKTVRCETRQCPAVDTVCDTGFEAIKVKKSEAECCEKYACVPANTTKPECDEPKPLLCGEDQVRKLEKRPDGCHDYVCQCKPLEECATLIDPRVSPSEASIPVGMERIVNDSGCCPKEELVCRPERCPKAPICPKYHHPEKQVIANNAETCCPEYKCVPPPDKCLFTHKYTQADAGGERELSSLEATVVLLDENATVQDGPCRQCLCQRIESTSEDVLHATCTRTECPVLSETADFKDYTLEPELVRGHCCPVPKRTACKHIDGTVHKPGEKWPLDPIKEPCTILECKSEDAGVVLTKHVVTCDTNCTLGSKYVEPKSESGECCGTCKQYACVVDGEIKNIGEEWKSEDFCTEYKCVNDEGTILVSRKQISCPEISKELLSEFEYIFTPIPGECCKKQEPIACLVDGVKHEIGETWPDPEGDPCISVTCLHASAGGNDLTQQKTVTTCNQQCKPGWRYQNPLNGYCCGECVQVACIVNGTEYAPSQTWTSYDGCTTFECQQQDDGTLSTSATQETCPDTTDCPNENLWQDGCCTKCNLTMLSKTQGCEAVKIALEYTVGLVVQSVESHGKCLNLEAIEGFTECRGQCSSGTEFNQKTSMHESTCTCCQVMRYTAVPVELVCQDGHQFTKQVAVPSECGCQGCAEVSAAQKQSAKKSYYGTKN